MKKMLHKGVVGAVIYVEALQLEKSSQPAPPDIQSLLDQYEEVFAEPSQLPPKREVDHKIPL